MKPLELMAFLIAGIVVCFVTVQLRGCQEAQTEYWIERNLKEGARE